MMHQVSHLNSSIEKNIKLEYVKSGGSILQKKRIIGSRLFQKLGHLYLFLAVFSSILGFDKWYLVIGAIPKVFMENSAKGISARETSNFELARHMIYTSAVT